MTLVDTLRPSPGRPMRPTRRAAAALGRAFTRFHDRGLPARIVLALVPMLAFVGGWWLWTVRSDRSPRVFPPPPDVWDEVVRILGNETPLGPALPHALATLGRAGTAFLVAALAGLGLGILAGRVKFVFDFLSNLMWITMAIPTILWVLILASTLGIGNVVPIVALAALVTPGVIITVAEAMKALPPDLDVMTRSFKFSQLDRVVWLYLPHTLPHYVGALRVASAMSLRMVLVAEVIGLTQGVGYLVQFSQSSTRMAPIIAWGVLLMAVGVVVDLLVFARLERKVATWR